MSHLPTAILWYRFIYPGNISYNITFSGSPPQHIVPDRREVVTAPIFVADVTFTL